MYAAKVVVIGAGVSGVNAAAIALGMQAEVLLLDKNVARLRQVDAIYQGHCQTVASNAYEVEKAVLDADLVIGAVLIPGAKAPTLISNELVSRMKPGSGARRHLHRPGWLLRGLAAHHARRAERTRCTIPSSTASPTCRARCRTPRPTRSRTSRCPTPSNSPTAGWRDALRHDAALAGGLNTHEGQLTNAPVAEAHGYDSVALADILT